MERDEIGLVTIGSDLATGAIGCHACLAGTLVGTILKTDYGLASLQDRVVELALVFLGNLDPEDRAVVPDLLGHSAHGEKVVYDHVEVLVLVQIVDLEEVLGLQTEPFAPLQV